MKNKIIGTIALIFGILWITGSIITITNNAIIGYNLQEPSITIGGSLAGGLVLIIGIMCSRYGYKKIKKEDR